MPAPMLVAVASLSPEQAIDLANKASAMIVEMYANQSVGAHGTFEYNGHKFRVRAYIGDDQNSLMARVLVVD